MGDLDTRNTALRMDEFRNARERFNVGFAPNSQVLRADARLRQNSRSLGHDQCRSADGPASEVNEVPIRGQSVFAGVLAHG